MNARIKQPLLKLVTCFYSEDMQTQYHSTQSDTIVEHLNQILAAQLIRFVEEHQRSWNPLVPLIMLAHQTAAQVAVRSTQAACMVSSV